MTGLVKEELLIRPAELGVAVRDGVIEFDRTFVGEGEPTREDIAWSVLTTGVTWAELLVPAGTQALTVCQVPILITLTDGDSIIDVDLDSGTTDRITGTSLGPELSAHVFARTGQIRSIRVRLGA